MTNRIASLSDAFFHAGKPLLAGDSDIDQLSKIFAALGTPTEEQWPVRNALVEIIDVFTEGLF